MPPKVTTYKLKKLTDGTWECKHRKLPNSFSTGATAEEALEKHQKVMAIFEEFCADMKAKHGI